MLLARLFVESERRIHQFFDERHTVELDELNIRFNAAIERETELPRTRENLRVLDSRFVLDVIRTKRCVAFYHMEFIAMEISCPVEPRMFGEPCYVNDERIALPSAIRPSVPRLTGRVV